MADNGGVEMRGLAVIGVAVSAMVVAGGCGQRLPAGARQPAAPPAAPSPGLEGASPSPGDEKVRVVPPPEENAPGWRRPGRDRRPGGPGKDTGSPSPVRGLGAWVDIFDTAYWRAPEGTVAALAGRGVRTLYLQTATYRFPGPIRFPRATARFLDAARGAGIRVVAWYVPDLADLRRDLRWSVAAAAFRSPSGARFDGFALDIEATEVADPAKRAARVVRLSRQIRQAVGPRYPLGAITPSPLRGPGFWPVLPIGALGRIYDAVLPMAYWTPSSMGHSAYAYIARSARITRSQLAGTDALLHMIGGITEDATTAEIRGFVRAVREAEVDGASLYDVSGTDPRVWPLLEKV